MNLCLKQPPACVLNQPTLHYSYIGGQTWTRTKVSRRRRIYSPLQLPLCDLPIFAWRGEWDSNPRTATNGLAVFKTALLNRLSISPYWRSGKDSNLRSLSARLVSSEVQSTNSATAPDVRVEFSYQPDYLLSRVRLFVTDYFFAI